MAILDCAGWAKFLEKWPETHLLQTSAWGELKSDFGWQALRVANHEAGAQVLFRRLPLGFTLAYIPKGPVGDNWKNLWPEIHTVCKEHNAVFLRVEPDGEELEADEVLQHMKGFIAVEEPIQPRQTIIVNLTESPEEWLGRMKQKTRYNTRLAEKKGVQVKQTQDFSTFEKLMETTGQRDGFGVHTKVYYQKAYEVFSKENKVALLQAEYEGKPLAALMVFYHGKRAYYLYGASGDEERQRMPTYLLQYEAMRWAAERNCTEYDLWGIPDAPEEYLENHFEERSDGLWGVYRFKRGYGGRIVRNICGFDYVYNSILYRILRWRMQKTRETDAG
ncbi:MAG: peptidoglycan bridge formation glycyltransferase FemA/FemB family protein [Leptolinea sp.]